MVPITDDKRISLVVDAACDLPLSYLKERNITLMPTAININGNIFTDDKDPQKLESFYKQGLLSSNHHAESIAYTSEQISHLIQQNLVPEYDIVFLQTVSRKKSLIYENSQNATHSVLKYAREHRANTNKRSPFALRVLNTGTLFCGQGALAAYTSDLILQEPSKQEVLRKASEMCHNIHAFIVPPSVDYVRKRARKKGEESVGFLTAMVARSLDIVPIIKGRNDMTEPAAKIRGFDHAVTALFEHAAAYLEAGLLSPYIIVSIAGDLQTLLDMPDYKTLTDQAKTHGVTVLPCVMGLTSGLNVGPGSIGMGFLAEDKDIPLA
jgi:DegV family protein with EDD domain